MLNYFVYKNGTGNFWSELAEKHGHFYVGFDDEWVQGRGQRLLPTRDNGGSKPHEGKVGDLNHIRFVMHEDNRSEFVLLTFEKTELRFWRVDGQVVEASKKLLSAAKDIHGEKGPYARYFTDDKSASTTRRRTSPPFRVLPVTKVAVIPRHEIYTSVDSLASYQYLIRGTCRPLWRARGPDAAVMPSKLSERRQAYAPRCERVGDETPFGAFIRLYLNEQLHRRGKLRTHTKNERLGSLGFDDRDIKMLVMATLNPILVETAALAIVNDLRLTPDIGVGKSKDVVDVRARAVGETGAHDPALARIATKKLQTVGVRLSDLVKRKLEERGTLDLQCKAADRAIDAGEIVYCGVAGEDRPVDDAILLDRLRDRLRPDDWPNLHRFLGMQARMISN